MDFACLPQCTGLPLSGMAAYGGEWEAVRRPTKLKYIQSNFRTLSKEEGVGIVQFCKPRIR